MADLDLLRSFMGIYRAGTISGAARHLGFTQPALSQHLKALEVQLGRPLFKRLPRGLAPTPVAHALAQSLGPHLDAMVATVEAARSGTDVIPGPLHLGGPAEIIGAKVLPTLCLCTIWQSGIQLNVRTGPLEEQVQALKMGTLDLLLSPRKLVAHRSLEAEAIYEEILVLVASPRWASKVNARELHLRGVAALEGIPLIACDEEPHPLHRYFLNVFGCEPCTSPSLVVDDLRASMAAAVGGLGAAVLPSHLCEEALNRGELIRLHQPEKPLTNTIYMLRKLNLKSNPRLNLVWDLIRKAAETW